MSAIIARIAPAAIELISATVCGDASSKTTQPTSAATPQASAMPPHTPNT